MAIKRFFHTATLLKDGRVLVAGGEDRSGRRFNTAELFDPSSGAWSAAATMHAAYSAHTATLLADGSVLVAGGGNAGDFSSSEKYDPTTDSWTTVGSLNDGRFRVYRHIAAKR